MHLIFSFGLDGILFALIKPYAWTSITTHPVWGLVTVYPNSPTRAVACCLTAWPNMNSKEPLHSWLVFYTPNYKLSLYVSKNVIAKVFPAGASSNIYVNLQLTHFWMAFGVQFCFYRATITSRSDNLMSSWWKKNSLPRQRASMLNRAGGWSPPANQRRTHKHTEDMLN